MPDPVTVPMEESIPNEPPIQSEEEAQLVLIEIQRQYELWPDAQDRPSIIHAELMQAERRLMVWRKEDGEDHD